MIVKISKINNSSLDLPLPRYETEGSAGMDVVADLQEPVTIEPFKVALIPTGIAIALEKGYECQVRSRSGLAIKHGIFALNSPGTIDSDYRGEIKIILANFSDKPFTISRGDRIAQLVVSKYEKVEWQLVDKLPQTERGEGGFGSTGISINK